jgi:two-component system, sensor histidine kinase and response regulator
VDGNRAASEALERMLATRGARVDLAANGAQAMRKVHGLDTTVHRFDLVFVAAVLGDEDGTQAARSLADATPSSRVVMLLNAAGAGSVAREVVPAATAGFLRKPLLEPELDRELKRVLQQEPGGAHAVKTAEAAAPQTGASILVAEDHPVNQQLVRRLLTRLGHKVEIAADGAIAVEAFGRAHFDLVFLDVQMPNVDGLEAARRIRAAEGGGARVPIIALTAHAMDRDRERCIAAGMDDYLTKPIDPDALKRMLARHLPKAPARPTVAPVLPAADDTPGSAVPEDRADATADTGLLDRGLLLRRSGDDVGLAAELLDLFVELQPERVDELEAVMAAGDRVNVAKVAHTLAGSFFTVAMEPLGELCRRIEQGIGAGKPDADIAPMVTQVRRDFAAVMGEAESLRRQWRTESAEAA